MTKQVLTVLSVADTQAIRRETFKDVEHMVVPTIALVEGVLTPSNALGPELALATEFGRFPEGWNGRPVMLNHPEVNGIKVSANIPPVIEREVFGQLFNTTLKGQKLKTEVWIDLDRVAELGGSVVDTVEALESGDLVEISTGLFSDTEDTAGKFNGEKFIGIWRNVVPDHLALLPVGVRGACSIEDGCGAPRVSASTAQEHPVTTPTGPAGASAPPTSIGERSCSVPFLSQEDNMQAPAATVVLDSPSNPGPDVDVDISTEGEGVAGEDPQVGIFKRLVEKFGDFLSFRSANNDISDADVRRALLAALEEETTGQFFFIMAVFDDNFIFEQGFEGTLLRRDFNISEDGSVELGEESEKVRPVTQFIPVTVNQEDDRMSKVDELAQSLVANEATHFTEDDAEWLKSLSEGQLGKLVPKEALVPTADVVTTVTLEGDAAPTIEADPKTLDEYIGDAPEEIQQVLQEGIRMQKARKSELVGALKANERCKYTPEQLDLKDIEELETLVELANIPNFSGQGGSIHTQASDDDAIPAPPEAFPKEQAAAA